jgi:hypothetical protein
LVDTYVNLLRPGGAWITGGPGTVTIGSVNGQMTIVADGTGLVYARRGVTTQVNKTYQLTWSNDTTTLMFRQIGTAEGLGDIRAANVSAIGDNKIEFVATTTTTWVSFQRTTAASVTISSLLLREIPAGASSARRLNGKNQYLSIDAQLSALRLSNANWYIGGFVSFNYMPIAGVYFMDFGRLDPSSPSGGAGRVRLFYDVDQDKISCSSSDSAATIYRENYLIKTLALDTWYYIGMTALTNADVLVRVGTEKGSSYIGTIVPTVSVSDVCRVLQFGAKVVNPRSSFSPCNFSNWIWASNWIPSDVQINLLAGGTPPAEVPGLAAPTGATLYHWPMLGATTEPSLIDTAAPLVSNSTYGSIVSVVGPVLNVTATVVPPQLDVIIT